MRRISFAMTEPQLVNGTKTVTRRLGWHYAKVGDRYQAIDKHSYRVKGASRVLGTVTIIDVRREYLAAITDADVVAEGFEGQSREWFIEMFCKAMGCSPGTIVTRLEFTFDPAPPVQQDLFA